MSTQKSAAKKQYKLELAEALRLFDVEIVVIDIAFVVTITLSLLALPPLSPSYHVCMDGWM